MSDILLLGDGRSQREEDLGICHQVEENFMSFVDRVELVLPNQLTTAELLTLNAVLPSPLLGALRYNQTHIPEAEELPGAIAAAYCGNETCRLLIKNPFNLPNQACGKRNGLGFYKDELFVWYDSGDSWRPGRPVKTDQTEDNLRASIILSNLPGQQLLTASYQEFALLASLNEILARAGKPPVTAWEQLLINGKPSPEILNVLSVADYHPGLSPILDQLASYYL